MTQSSTIDILKAGGGEAGAGDAIERAARRMRCDKAVLQAILEVESGADAYDDKGRLIILPEKHVFHRELPMGLRAKALKLGLAARKWTRANYKGLGGKGSDKRWVLLGRMVDYHETAGLRSASYGGSQIMGFNHKICGYDSVAEFVLAMAETEEAQIEAFVRFLEGVGLSADLRDRDFRAIARRYNGSGQVTKYAGMMERAYRRVAGKAAKPRSSKRGRNLRLGSEGRLVKALQERLVELGYHVVIDGDYGPATRRAVVQFQADRGLKADGIVGPKTSDGLDDAVAIPDQPGGTRDNMKVKDLRERGSQTVKEADRLTQVGGIATGGGLLASILTELSALLGSDPVGGIGDLISEIRTAVEPLAGLVPSNKWLIVIGIGVAVMVFAHRIKQRRLHDAVTWRHVG